MQLVLTLSRELELLKDDNVQLRAAIGMYEELLKVAKPRIRTICRPRIHRP